MFDNLALDFETVRRTPMLYLFALSNMRSFFVLHPALSSCREQLARRWE